MSASQSIKYNVFFSKIYKAQHFLKLKWLCSYFIIFMVPCSLYCKCLLSKHFLLNEFIWFTHTHSSWVHFVKVDHNIFNIYERNVHRLSRYAYIFYWKHFIRDPQQKTLETPTMLQRKENLLLFWWNTVWSIESVRFLLQSWEHIALFIETLTVIFDDESATWRYIKYSIDHVQVM